MDDEKWAGEGIGEKGRTKTSYRKKTCSPTADEQVEIVSVAPSLGSQVESNEEPVPTEVPSSTTSQEQLTDAMLQELRQKQLELSALEG